jgi:hypothetical protein
MIVNRINENGDLFAIKKQHSFLESAASCNQAMLPFPNAGGSILSNATVSTTFHDQ